MPLCARISYHYRFQVPPEKIAQNIKGKSSYWLQREFRELQNNLALIYEREAIIARQKAL